MRVDRFNALANPIRVAIVAMLRQRPMTAGEITKRFNISQPSISRHLDVLKRAEMVTTRKQGVLLIYTLNLAALQGVIDDTTDLLMGTVEPEDISEMN